VSADPLADDLAAWGKVIRLHTTGRRSGRRRTVTIGFAEEDDGSLLVAAASDATGWAANLRAMPACIVERAGQRTRCSAETLQGSERAAAITRLVLKYGTPAERLGAGPAFRLTCAD
jgi:deazaflavin-dependent oxidoreductase (nitroreductase family)